MNTRLLVWTLTVLVGLLTMASADLQAQETEDPFLWLEEVEGESALNWARGQNERSEAYLQAHPLFESLQKRNLEILTSEDRIAYPSLRGGEVYNFWRDAEHVRGIWRKTSLDNYRNDEPAWDVLLDVDALATTEDQNWVWAGSSCRYPDYDRCIIGLSIGGADAAVRREFDLKSRTFVEDGFEVPESKSRLGWRDLDSVFLGPAFDATQMTDSGYPRLVQIWQRGTPIESAVTVFEGEQTDVAVSGIRIWDGAVHHDLIVRSPTFFTRHYYVYRDGNTERVVIPDDADLVGLINGQMLVELKSDWEQSGRTYPQGSLIAASMEDFLTGSVNPEIVFRPTQRSAISQVVTTDNTVILNILDNVVARLERFTYDNGRWQSERLDAPPMGALSIVTADDRSDQFFFNYTGFLTPSSLYEADAILKTQTKVRSEPAWFDAQGMVVNQYEATSADGEQIPYFVVKPADYSPDRTYPTLLSAYGGFEISRTPFYSGIIGSGWLSRGGIFVLANIRGGGEFGPRWHQAALQDNRQRAFDDLIAVSEDLIARGLTEPAKLGIQGGSNGGLLVGAVMVQRPDLFNAVVCQVPLLDMKRFHKLLAGASWMAEYGNPDDPEDWAYISQYSPYQNVSEDRDYPKAFFTTSTRDDRVHPGHARKMVARMLDQGHDVLYYENIEGGHGGAANLKQSAYLNALIHAYLHDRLSGSGG
jgi:prolyl oligopeptidase